MRIMYVGDVMGERGLEFVEEMVPILRSERQIDFVVAQSENVSQGKGISLDDFQRLRNAGVDFCSGGNWSLHKHEIFKAMNDPSQPIIRPANYPYGTAGLGYKYAETPKGKVLVVSLLGKIVGKDSTKTTDNPLRVIDQILDSQRDVLKAAVVVNFHGDYSSEKVVIGHYLDGRATLVVGDHWHVPTADARILPEGTAHITDVGMVGVLNASLGVSYSSVIPRWRDGVPTLNVLEFDGPKQFNAVLVETNEFGLAASIEQIQHTLPAHT